MFFIILLALAFFLLGPMAILWALNTLFPALALAYTFWNWLAVLILMGLFRAEVNVKK